MEILKIKLHVFHKALCLERNDLSQLRRVTTQYPLIIHLINEEEKAGRREEKIPVILPQNTAEFISIFLPTMQHFLVFVIIFDLPSTSSNFFSFMSRHLSVYSLKGIPR